MVKKRTDVYEVSTILGEYYIFWIGEHLTYHLIFTTDPGETTQS